MVGSHEVCHAGKHQRGPIPYPHSPTPHRLPDRLSILYLVTHLPQGWSLSPDSACSLRQCLTVMTEDERLLHPKENSLPWTSSILQDGTEQKQPPSRDMESDNSAPRQPGPSQGPSAPQPSAWSLPVPGPGKHHSLRLEPFPVDSWCFDKNFRDPVGYTNCLVFWPIIQIWKKKRSEREGLYPDLTLSPHCRDPEGQLPTLLEHSKYINCLCSQGWQTFVQREKPTNRNLKPLRGCGLRAQVAAWHGDSGWILFLLFCDDRCIKSKPPLHGETGLLVGMRIKKQGPHSGTAPRIWGELLPVQPWHHGLAGTRRSLHMVPQEPARLSLAWAFPPTRQPPLWGPNGRDRCPFSKKEKIYRIPPSLHTYTNTDTSEP